MALFILGGNIMDNFNDDNRKDLIKEDSIEQISPAEHQPNSVSDSFGSEVDSSAPHQNQYHGNTQVPPIGNGYYNYTQNNPVLHKPRNKVSVLFVAIISLLVLLFGSAILIVVMYSMPVQHDIGKTPDISYGDTDDIYTNPIEDDNILPDLPQTHNPGDVIIIDQKSKPNPNDSNYAVLNAVGVAKIVSNSVVEIWTYANTDQFQPNGQGSGIVLTTDGYIITNAHVVEAAKKFLVMFSDGTEYEALLVGMDLKTDLAVLKVDANGLDAAIFGNSDELELGEDIITIGSPSGLSGTITKGIVSGLNRRIISDYDSYQMNCIQIDAAISPGNSGGALVNMYGQVVGINSSKYVSHEIEGIGFAISINEARPIIETLIKDGEIKGRVRIGIVFVPVSDTVAKMSGKVAGLHIQSIDDECDIAQSGLRINDVITHINSTKVTTLEQVHDLINDKSPGDKISATIYREHSDEGETLEITFKLESDD